MDAQSEHRAEALRAFVSRHPDGWHHGDWERLVGELRGRGLLPDGQEDLLGKELERERVRQILESLEVPGLGPKRREAVAEAFGHVWKLRNASVEDVVSLPTISRRIAADLVAALR
ncbi:MAG: helix-hairpin-helix domain-containing protein [Gemmatimonadota bacterium]